MAAWVLLFIAEAAASFVLLRRHGAPIGAASRPSPLDPANSMARLPAMSSPDAGIDCGGIDQADPGELDWALEDHAERGEKLGPLCHREDAPQANLAVQLDLAEAGSAASDNATSAAGRHGLALGARTCRMALLAKWCLDRIGALALLVCFAPALLSIGLMIAATSPGPIILRQPRWSSCGREFRMLRFRTTRAQQLRARTVPVRHSDGRLTPVGRLLRAYSLDHFPQLLNVMRGEMSLVGPRPHAGEPGARERAGREILAEYAKRYCLKPGLTGWAQVNGLRDSLTGRGPDRRRMQYDLFYLEHWSLWLDLAILARTPFCLAAGRLA